MLERLALRDAEARLKHAACSHPPADWGACPLTLAEREARQQAAPPPAHPHNTHHRVELQYHPAERLHSASVSLGKTDHHLYTTPKRSTKREVRDPALAWLREHDTTQREEPTP